MKIIKLDTTKSLIKPPISQRLKAGMVVLKKGEEIGQHSTHDKEEALIILAGQATLAIKDITKKVQANYLVYIPKDTLHNVRNENNSTLKYVYLTTLLN